MKKFKKIIVLFLIGILCTSNTVLVKAEFESQQSNIAEFDLSSKQAKTYKLQDSNGSFFYCTIEPLASATRINNGSYRISHTVPDRWKASFIITISSNKIASVSSPTATPIKGSIKNISLKKINNISSALTFTHTYLSISDYTGFKCYITNNTLKTQKI